MKTKIYDSELILCTTKSTPVKNSPTKDPQNEPTETKLPVRFNKKNEGSSKSKGGQGGQKGKSPVQRKISVKKSPPQQQSQQVCILMERKLCLIKKLGMSTSSLLKNAFLISNRWFQIFQPSLAGPRATVPPIWARSRWSIITTCSRRVAFIHPPIQFLGQREKRTGKTSGAQAGEALVAVTYSAGTDFYQL